MNLFTALTVLDTPFDDMRYAVLLEYKGYPFIRYIVIPSDIKIQYYGLDLSVRTAWYGPDIERLLTYCVGRLLPEMPQRFQSSDQWQILTGSEFKKYHESLWRDK